MTNKIQILVDVMKPNYFLNVMSSVSMLNRPGKGFLKNPGTRSEDFQNSKPEKTKPVLALMLKQKAQAHLTLKV